MKERPYVIGVFVSTPSVDQCLHKIGSQGDHVFRVANGTLNDAVVIGKKMEEEGVEVIVSRRGSAHLLRENLSIPVLSLPQSSLNVLSSLRQAAKKGRKIFLPSFGDKRSGLEVIGKLLKIDFAQEIYTDASSLQLILAKAAQAGFEVAVGGMTTMRYALELNMKYCELVSSEEEVREAIENAKSVAQSQRDRKATSLRYQTIIDAASDGIIAVDSNGFATMINQVARNLLGVREEEVVGFHIDQLFPGSAIPKVLRNKQPIRDKVANIKNELFVFNHLPILVEDEVAGVVSSFTEAAKVIQAENKVRRRLTKGFVANYVIEDLIYKDHKMEQVANMCRDFSKTDSCILISGETGTGKEILAQSIHNLSKRKIYPFVSVHCAALPEQLLESELFGYDEGAFTGSKKGGKPGLFELAHQGTVFLDEIDSTSLNVQLHLLRVLQEKEVMRVGSDYKVPVNIRVIAAAGRDLWQAVQNGTFRKDLFFRLNVLRISIPPLSQRKGDIPKLLNHFCAYYSNKYGLKTPSLPSYYMEQLMNYSWPGNVRQLRHFAEQLLLNCNIHCGYDTLTALLNDLSSIVEQKNQESKQDIASNLRFSNQAEPGTETDEERIRQVLQQTKFNKKKAAEIMGIGRTTLWRKMKELRIEA